LRRRQRRMSIENRGSVVKIHSSGMVESDKGYKYPYNRANIGDMMIDIDGERVIIPKEEYRKKYQKSRKQKTLNEEEIDNG